MHSLSHHSANDIPSHTCRYDYAAGLAGFGARPPGGDVYPERLTAL